MKYITILEVIDNFFGDSLPDFATLPAETIESFGAEVRRFATGYVVPSVNNEDMFPSFLGGWPSARWNDHSPLVMTSMLYSGQVLVKDPVIDWFCEEQYLLPTTVPTDYGMILFRQPTGYKQNQQNLDYNLEQTRLFLHRTISSIIQARPLIESGILVLVGSKIFEQRNQQRAEALAEQLLPFTIPNVRAFTDQFRPVDIPISDIRRGMFMIGQSSDEHFIEKQIRRYIQEALYYFSTEFLLASEYNFDYTSTFSFEEHVCHAGLSQLINRGAGSRVYQGMLHSKFPLYEGLTPSILAQIRDDDNYVAFRKELFQIYANINDDNSRSQTRRNIREAEEALLRPILDNIERSERIGPLSRLGFSRLSVVRLAATVLTGILSTGLDPLTSTGILGEVVQSFAQRSRKTGTVVIWKKLFNHQRTLEQEFNAEATASNNTGRLYWGVPLRDGLHVTVTEGIHTQIDDLTSI